MMLKVIESNSLMVCVVQLAGGLFFLFFSFLLFCGKFGIQFDI